MQVKGLTVADTITTIVPVPEEIVVLQFDTVEWARTFKEWFVASGRMLFLCHLSELERLQNEAWEEAEEEDYLYDEE